MYLVLYGIEWSQCWFTLCSFSQFHLGHVEIQLGLEVQLGLKVCGGSSESMYVVHFGQVQLGLKLKELEPKTVKLNTK